MLRMIGILLGVALGLALLAGALDSFGRFGGYLPLVQYGPLLLLFLVGSFAGPLARPRARVRR